MQTHKPSEKKPQFSGHETFPLRQLWLKKAYKAVDENLTNIKGIFSDDQAIVRFGVGKNMVSAIRHWGLAAGIIDGDESAGYKTTLIADQIFGNNGLDPFQEHPSTAWLIHWNLASVGRRSTTWSWFFNQVIEPKIDSDQLLTGLQNFAKANNYKIASATLKRDLECCLRSYVPKVADESPEEISDSVLGELGLILQTGRGIFEFKRGAKHSLNGSLFAYCLIDFWENYSPTTQTLTFEAIAHEHGSPGRVFKLDESSVAERVQALNDVTRGQLIWSDTAGMRQVIRTSTKDIKMKLLSNSYD